MSSNAGNGGNPTGSAGGRYALVRTRIILGEGPVGVRVLFYNVKKEAWDDMTFNDEAIDYIIRYKSATIGFTSNGFHATIAIPIDEASGWLSDYIVDYTDEVPKRPIIVNDGVYADVKVVGDRVIVNVRRLGEERDDYGD